jgi:hypothetical protein
MEVFLVVGDVFLHLHPKRFQEEGSISEAVEIVVESHGVDFKWGKGF